MWSCPLRSSCKNVLYHCPHEGMSSPSWEECMCVCVCVCVCVPGKGGAETPSPSGNV